MTSSDYEAWVRALRAWGQDPATDLSQLPSLSLESFPAATYERFLGHLRDAVSAMMTRWSRDFSARLSLANGEQEYARALVDARKGLARRLLLAEHPGLPEQVRDALMRAARSDIEATQAELLQGVGAAYGQVAMDTTRREQHLRIVRDNSLTAVLAPGFPLAEFVAGRYAQPTPTVPTAPTDRPNPFGPTPRRHIVTD